MIQTRGVLSAWPGQPVASGALANGAATAASFSVHVVDDPDGPRPTPSVPAPVIRFSVWAQDDTEEIIDEAVIRSDAAGDAGSLSVPRAVG